VPLPRGEDAWLHLALDVVPAYVASEFAVVWPEVEARLGETGWITDNHDSTFPATAGIQPHILHRARTLLVANEVLVPEAASLSGRTVTAFRLFRDPGAIGSATYRHWFFNPGTTRARIDIPTFDRARSTFGFHDAVLLDDQDAPQPIVVRFFTDTVRTPVDGQPLIVRRSERWARSSAIVADYTALRDEDLDWDERRELMTELASRIEAEGLLDAGGWAPPAP